ncbi:MAG: NACHT domain-containing protein, partial [Chloroflexia bacterium]|nr:NACHT domain-containing protein [Chloroflexia bacterium]
MISRPGWPTPAHRHKRACCRHSNVRVWCGPAHMYAPPHDASVGAQQPMRPSSITTHPVCCCAPRQSQRPLFAAAPYRGRGIGPIAAIGLSSGAGDGTGGRSSRQGRSGNGRDTAPPCPARCTIKTFAPPRLCVNPFASSRLGVPPYRSPPSLCCWLCRRGIVWGRKLLFILTMHHMTRKEEIYALITLLVAVVGTIGTWLALPQVQPWLNEQLAKPFFLPFVIAVVLLLAVVLFLVRNWLVAKVRLLFPRRRVEADYLKTLQHVYGQTPDLLAAGQRSNMRLIEAFSPLSLSPYRPNGLEQTGGSSVAHEELAVDAEEAVLRQVRLRDGRRLRGPRSGEAPGRVRQVLERVVYWGLWALAQGLLLAVLLALCAWLLREPAGGWRLDWWRVMLALCSAGGWFVAARWLHNWLVGKDDVLEDLLTWWRRLSICIAEPGTPGAEIWAHPRLLLLGDPGSGKTTLMRHLAVICALERLGTRSQTLRVRTLYGWPACPFPLYIPMRDLDLKTSDKDLLQVYAQKLADLFAKPLPGCDGPFFAERLKQGGCLILVDAFDEVRAAGGAHHDDGQRDIDMRTWLSQLIAALPAGPRQRPNRV